MCFLTRAQIKFSKAGGVAHTCNLIAHWEAEVGVAEFEAILVYVVRLVSKNPKKQTTVFATKIRDNKW